MPRLFLVILCACLGTTVGAETEQQKAATQLMAAGFNDYGNRRHEIHIDDCVMTTFVYEDWEDHGKVLWSSFLVNLKDLQLPDRQKDGNRFLWIPNFGEKNAAMFPFSMAPGSIARHEMAMRRNPKPPYRPSDRSGPDSFVFKDKTSFFILHEGQETSERAALFISLLEQYRLEFCFPLS